MDDDSASMVALRRMKAAADGTTGPERTRGDDVQVPPERNGHRPGTDIVPDQAARRPDTELVLDEAAHRPDGVETRTTIPERPARPPATPRLRHANHQQPLRPKDSLNDWLDALGEPDWDRVSQAIYDSPAHMKSAYDNAKVRLVEERERRAQERRQAEVARREAAERAEAQRREAERRAEQDRRRAEQERLKAERLAEEERLEAERVAAARAEAERLAAVHRAREQARLAAERQAQERARIETERLLEAQRAEEEALRQEQERREHEEWLQRQRERETWALQTAAREADGIDWIPPAERRPLLEERGEELSDAQLLDRARAFLPEWRHRDRIVEKAQAIEAATQRARSAAATLQEQRESGSSSVRYIPPYNLPSREPDPAPTVPDLLRRITVTLAWCVFVAGGAYGLGLLGEDPATPWLHELHEGRYSGNYSMLSMASWAMLVWPVLWLVMGGYTVHQWAPSQAAAARQRATGWRVALAMVGAAAWFVFARTGILSGVELVVWLAVTYLLVDSIHHLNLHTARTRTERAITDGVIGLFTGWAIIYAATNTSIVLQSLGVNLLWIPGAVWAVLTLIAVIWGTALLSMTERGRITIALGLAWGLIAILVPRLIGSMPSVWVAIIAAMGLFVVLLATGSRRYRINRAEHRAALGHAVDEV